MHNLVIKMEEGNIYEIVWDNGCFDCTQENCVKEIFTKSVFDPSQNKTYDNCKEIEHKIKNENEEEKEEDKTNDNKQGEQDQQGQKEKENEQEEPKENAYIPKFYITWFGTDKNKRQLKTAGLAMTKFKPYIVTGTFYSKIKGLFDKN